MPDTEIVGRDEELRTISSFVQRTPPSGALLIEGDAGIGKTTLWRAGVEASRELSYCVLRASPAEKEETFSYSVVSDLLADVLDDVLPGLPRPQRRALEIALLLRDSEGPPPERHTLGVALLGVLRILAASKPVVLAVDDLQWLDRSSAAVLEFAGGYEIDIIGRDLTFEGLAITGGRLDTLVLRDPQGNAIAAINIRCLEGIDLDAVPVQHYDGRSK